MIRRLNPLRLAFFAAAVVAIVGAVGVRFTYRKPPEPEHNHGGDPKLAAEIAALSPDARVPELQKALGDESPGRRLTAAGLLDSNKGTLPLAQHALRDSDSAVRDEALHTIATLDSKGALPYLLAALADCDESLRESAVSLLNSRSSGPHGARETQTIGPLIAALDDPDRSIAPLAISALRHLTGIKDVSWHLSPRAEGKERTAVIGRWKSWWTTAKKSYPPSPDVPDIRPERADPAPSLTIGTIDARPIEPSTSGQVTLINFWATWCEPCREELPGIQSLHESLGGQGLTVVGVAVSETKGADGVRAYCAKNKMTYPQALGEDVLLEAYGNIQDLPVTILVDKHGRIRYRFVGIRSAETFRPAILRLLAE